MGTGSLPPGVILHLGKCEGILRGLPDCTADSVVTDPPYGLEFMGSEWDTFKGEAWRAGAGLSRPGIGDRPTEWPSFGGAESANPTCAVCGHRKRGKRKCGCEQPDWRVKGAPLGARNAGLEQMRAFQSWCEQWAAECLRILKPGGYLVAFGGTRTWHRLTCGVEDAGFEIRGSIHWFYASGFPKNKNVAKAIDKAAGAEREVVAAGKPVKRMIPGADQNRTGSWIKDNGRQYTPEATAPATDDAARWEGWGTALKPAHEPILVARKPFTGPVEANVLEWGTGALNLAACSVPHADAADRAESEGKNRHAAFGSDPGGVNVYGDWSMTNPRNYDGASGRWAPDILFAHTPLCADPGPCHPVCPVGELERQRPGASRFYPVFRYQPKANRWERPVLPDGTRHPTVKPVALMQWLVRLATRPGGTVLDPFAGSGTTLQAALAENMQVTGIEQDPRYVEMCRLRLRETQVTLI